VNLNWPREISTTQFEFMRLSQLATSGKLLLGRRGACGGMARKLIVALWLFLEAGVIPEGAKTNA
jgi:hypothetical protein